MRMLQSQIDSDKNEAVTLFDGTEGGQVSGTAAFVDHFG